MNSNYKLGSNPSPPDEKDYPISKIIGAVNVFPDNFVINYNGEIKNQELFMTCVPHSLCYCRETIEDSQLGWYKKFAPGFIYANRDAGDYQGEGMYPREALKGLQEHGVVEYDLFPFNNDYYGLRNKFLAVEDELMPKAEPYRISTYCRLYTISDIKNALMQLGPVTICIPIPSNFYGLSEGNIVPMPVNIDIDGYHEVTIFGWRADNTWIVLNSWGKYWGDNGKCYLPFSFPITEAWSITDVIYPLHSEDEVVNQKYWRIQLGGFRIKENAIRKQKEIFEKIGQESYIVLINGLYKVQLGAFSIEANARAFSQSLKGMNIENFITYY